MSFVNIARGTTDPGYWVHNSNHPNSKSMLIVELTLLTWSALFDLFFAFEYFYKTQEVVFLVFLYPLISLNQNVICHWGWFELWTQYPGSVVPLAMFMILPSSPTILILQILFPSQLTWKQGRRILYSHAAYIWIVLLFKYTKNSRRWENSLFKSGSGLQAEITLCFPNLFTFDHFLLAELPECQVKTRVVGRLPDAESNFVRGWYQSSKSQNLYNQICSFQSCV